MEIVNCEHEMKLFEDLVKCNTEKRILSIKSPSGTGKTQLLRKFKYHCQTQTKPIPVASVSLDTHNVATPFALVEQIADELRGSIVEFSTFDSATEARVFHDIAKLRSIRQSMAVSLQLPRMDDDKSRSDYFGEVKLDGASFDFASNTNIAGIINNLNIDGQVNEDVLQSLFAALGGGQKQRLDEKQQKMADEICIMAFFYDINRHWNGQRRRKHRSKHPIVLLVDTYDEIGDTLRSWLNKYFIKNYFLDVENRPSKFVLVIAGQDVPDYKSMVHEDTYTRSVNTVDKLSTWSENDVKNAARIAGIINIDEVEPILLMHKKTPSITPLALMTVMSIYAKEIRSNVYE